MTVKILTGDCRDILPTLEANSVDAVVCDPPYDLTTIGRSFQGKGGTIRPDGGQRSERRTVGFMGKEWDGTGVAFYPATWDAVKRVLKPGGFLLAFGGTRTFHRMTCAIEDAGFEIKDCLSWLYGSGFPKHKTLLKPAWEPIVVAKKRGAGGLQIEACRIGTGGQLQWAEPRDMGYHGGTDSGPVEALSSDVGRWPANVVLDEVAAEMLDEQSGTLTSGAWNGQRNAPKFQSVYRVFDGELEQRKEADSGGASRFFYTAKASRSERGDFNTHCTVKPLSLMTWLVKLVTPVGGTVLDPFAGSGSTLIAADRAGFDAIGIELDPEYAEIARRRVSGDSPMFANVEVA